MEKSKVYKVVWILLLSTMKLIQLLGKHGSVGGW